MASYNSKFNRPGERTQGGGKNQSLSTLAQPHIYSYDLPGFSAENITQSPDVVFARWGGLQGYLNSLAQDGSNRTGGDGTTTTDSSVLTRPMRALAIGDRIPVVFGRRRAGGTGGVLVQPRATEVQLSNNASTLSVKWHCVLGDGQMESIQTRDVRNGLFRQGTYSQNYNRRAGSWAPGNRTQPVPGVELPGNLPLQCGVGGDYLGVSTIEFGNSYPITSTRWSQAWSVFVRGGLIIERGRLLDDVVGPSDNICDLIIWAMVKSGRMTEDQIDLVAMESAALFCEANGLLCNAEFADAASIPDFLTGILPGFLLRETTIGGKFALVPVLPVNSDGTIKTTEIVPDFHITEEAIAPGSWSETMAPASAKGPLRIVCSYRQQTSDVEPPLTCSLAIGAATDTLPTVEELNLSGFCTSRLHAATVGGYRHAMRTLAGATASVTVMNSNATGRLTPGKVVRASFRIETEQEQGWIDGFWQITSSELDTDGNETVQLAELPLNSSYRSIVSLQVAAARGAAGDLVFPYPVISSGDVPGRSTDTTVTTPTTSGIPFSAGGSGVQGTTGGGEGGGEGGGGSDGDDITQPPADPPVSPPGGGGSPWSGSNGRTGQKAEGGANQDAETLNRGRIIFGSVCEPDQIRLINGRVFVNNVYSGNTGWMWGEPEVKLTAVFGGGLYQYAVIYQSAVLASPPYPVGKREVKSTWNVLSDGTVSVEIDTEICLDPPVS